MLSSIAIFEVSKLNSATIIKIDSRLPGSMNNTYNIDFKCLLLLLCLVHFGAMGQNLVKNSSFEAYKKCPKTLTEKKLKLKGQVKNVKGLPNYFNGCSQNLSGVKNPYGYQIPQEGYGFMGLTLTSAFRNQSECANRDYVQLKLSEPLVAGNKYQFSMFVNLANNSGYATDQIGVVFTSDDRTKKGISKFLGHADINNPLDHFLNDTVNWTEVSGIYNAKGGERYLIIGNFQGCDLSSRKPINPTDSVGTMNNMKRKYMEGLSTEYAHIDS